MEISTGRKVGTVKIDTIYDPPVLVDTAQRAHPEKGSDDDRIDDFDGRVSN